jgi:serine/threonine-protein kinase
MLSGTVGLEVLGVLPYAPDSVEWARSAPWTVPRGLAFIVLFSTLGISAGALVGRVVDDLRAERKLNQELLAKLVIGNYQLERIIGQGGMGQVWEAIDRRDQARVALKFLSAGAHRSEAARSRFMREMRLAATIDHPHVVALRDAFEMDDGIPVMVMDLLVGETLATRLAREGKLSLGEAARILLPVVSAVGRAHELGIIHRDLKPENIFLQKIAGKPEHPMVLDFGVAKHAERERAEETAALTETGVTVGTPAYMAPEQAFGERDLDHRLDVWALGVILYECLAGVRPFDSDNRAQLFRALMFEEAMPIAERCPGLPADVAALVGKMLARQRDRRLSDLREVRDVLSVHATTRSPSFGPPISARRLEKTTEVAPPPEDADTEPESAKAQGQAELDRG